MAAYGVKVETWRGEGSSQMWGRMTVIVGDRKTVVFGPFVDDIEDGMIIAPTVREDGIIGQLMGSTPGFLPPSECELTKSLSTNQYRTAPPFTQMCQETVGHRHGEVLNWVMGPTALWTASSQPEKSTVVAKPPKERAESWGSW